MTYGEKMKRICERLSIDTKELPDKLYGTLLDAIDNCAAGMTESSVSGEVIRIDDVSPVEQEIGVKVKSKNLIPYPYAGTVLESNGLTYAYNGDGTISVNGTVTDTFSSLLLHTKLSLVDGETYYIGNDNHLYLAYKNEAGATQYVTKSSFTWSDKYTFVRLYLQYSSGETVDGIVKPMLCTGDTATEYTPYVDVSTVKVTRCGKNLLNLNNVSGDIEGLYRGWLVNPTEQSVVVSMIDKGTTVDLSTVYFGVTTNGVNATEGCEWLVEKGEVRRNSYTGTFKYFSVFPINSETLKKIQQKFDIQVEYGTTATEYEAPKSETYTPGADGVVNNVTSVAPTMTLFTDTEDATLEVTYTKVM